MNQAKTKRNKLELLEQLFTKRKVLKLEDLSGVIGSESRRTIYRYVKELKYFTSYTHNGQYYTLEKIAKFNEHGLWHFDDIGFSKHGGLCDTIIYFVEHSEAGLTSRELQEEAHTIVKYALLDLVEQEKIVRTKSNKTYLYISPHPTVATNQLNKRNLNIIDQQTVDQETVIRVLLAAYRCAEKVPSPEKIAAFLQEEDSKITLQVVLKVLQHYGIEKKTQVSIL